MTVTRCAGAASTSSATAPHSPASVSPRARIHARAAKVSRLHRDVLHLFDGAVQDIAIEHDEVGELARLERSFPPLLEGQESVVDRVQTNRLLAVQPLLGM